ncbi:MAG: polysaccharide deacetylase family protein [Acidithiobacillus ferrooxidans]|nr:polysaccharide deacetylase family protein [Acidithiobacillus ferrooxidans]MDD5377769.1 polysaccharide deacetylase family protein [Acidithiobacillus sp.]MDD5577299.1 polysaccharide deacetylase family protein [Acidithiobacillus sp.]
MYHNIAVAPKGVRLRGLYVSPRRFARQMALLHWLGYRGLSMSAALPYLRGEREGKVAVITLDDGYRDNLECALPVLLHYGYTATCYVVSAAIGTDNHWDAQQLGTHKPLMDLNELCRWRDAGMEIGAHSRHHPHLPELSESELDDEVAGSRRELEGLLAVPVTQFCYPYGAAGLREREAARRAGFAAAVTVRRGRAQPGGDLFGLPRVMVGGHHAPHVFPLQLLTMHEDHH